ncbi:Bug family tripartite tricarboxylate transporter substrate binding protein [Rhodobium gokarnense]|uniref:Tripartite-type tricarboxylate transporter receptor subunit TctC n=1 Tax=Rhodobium gokarnense TaxID=364296 RepID=A0ABT3H7D0_9HYPH|nr:tripartite tricarboxylate transporter substrate binding protein [Rhodobium gokarnense]MCW2306307.1 tripartite-type tricarboxylate transporter receptor subunit TctC [Rhodobium gokarnense]
MKSTVNRRDFIAGSLTLGAVLGTPALVRAATDWPTRPITVAMTAPAGGGTDRGVRPLVSLMKDKLGAPRISIQDMSSAGGVQGTNWVHSQPADGYAWLGSGDQIDTYAMMGRYDYTWRDFDFWMAAGTPATVLVPAASPYKTMEELVADINKRPGEVTCATTPSGTGWSILATYLEKAHDLKFRAANFSGGGPTVRGLLAGETDFAVVGLTPAAAFVKSGELRVLAATVPEDWNTLGVTAPSLLKFFPDDQVMKDTFPWTNANGIALRPDTPDGIKQQVDDAFAAVVDGDEMRQVYEDNAYFFFGLKGHTDSNAFMKKRAEFWGYLLEDVTGLAKVSREKLGITKL